MVKNHLKSLAAPRTWPIKRKKNVFVTRPKQSGHQLDFSLPLNIIFKDILRYCKTTKEVQKVLLENNVLVDGKKAVDPHTPLGFLGTLQIDKTKENYRMTLSKLGKLEIKKIDKKEADLKVVKIKNKNILGKNNIQLNMSDGRNILIKKNDYKTGDTLLLSLPKQEVKEHIKLEKGSIILLSRGRRAGTVGTIENIEGNTIKFIGEDKKIHETKKMYAFPIGGKKASITV
ncbi:30S ribosomal protein S4e [Candidatus Woesearchaeota archaeon]|nr:30S ribosomal protein S4e [Candidatus Woesearchaeota archaeon]